MSSSKGVNTSPKVYFCPAPESQIVSNTFGLWNQSSPKLAFQAAADNIVHLVQVIDPSNLTTLQKLNDSMTGQKKNSHLEVLWLSWQRLPSAWSHFSSPHRLLLTATRATAGIKLISPSTTSDTGIYQVSSGITFTCIKSSNLECQFKLLWSRNHHTYSWYKQNTKLCRSERRKLYRMDKYRWAV